MKDASQYARDNAMQQTQQNCLLCCIGNVMNGTTPISGLKGNNRVILINAVKKRLSFHNRTLVSWRCSSSYKKVYIRQTLWKKERKQWDRISLYFPFHNGVTNQYQMHKLKFYLIYTYIHIPLLAYWCGGVMDFFLLPISQLYCATDRGSRSNTHHWQLPSKPPISHNLQYARKPTPVALNLVVLKRLTSSVPSAMVLP